MLIKKYEILSISYFVEVIIYIHLNIASDLAYVVDEEWMQRWKEYLFSGKKYQKRNFVKGLPTPGPIDNKVLINQNG